MGSFIKSLLHRAAKAVSSSSLAHLLAVPLPQEPAGSATHRLHGVEIFPGVGTPISHTTRYGATFVAAERGRNLVIFIGWLNYSPIFFKPSTECVVVGGRWWMVMVQKMLPCGVMGGSFEEGWVRWNRSAKLAEASIRLGAPGVRGELSAVLNHLPFPPSPPRISGVLTLFQQTA